MSVEPALHLWDNFHLAVIYDLFDVVLDSVCFFCCCCCWNFLHLFSSKIKTCSFHVVSWFHFGTRIMLSHIVCQPHVVFMTFSWPTAIDDELDMQHSCQPCMLYGTCYISRESWGTDMPSRQLYCLCWVGGLSTDTLLPFPNPFFVYMSLCLPYNKQTCSISLWWFVLKNAVASPRWWFQGIPDREPSRRMHLLTISANTATSHERQEGMCRYKPSSCHTGEIQRGGKKRMMEVSQEGICKTKWRGKKFYKTQWGKHPILAKILNHPLPCSTMVTAVTMHTEEIPIQIRTEKNIYLVANYQQSIQSNIVKSWSNSITLEIKPFMY